jgi:hypothetical protein
VVKMMQAELQEVDSQEVDLQVEEHHLRVVEMRD